MKDNGLFSLLFGAIWLIAGSLCMVAGIHMIVSFSQFKKQAGECTAVITEIERIEQVGKDAMDSYTPYIEYEVNGVWYREALSYYDSSSMWEGQEIKIYYHLADPGEVYSSQGNGGKLFTIAGAILLLVSFFCMASGVMARQKANCSNQYKKHTKSSTRKSKNCFHYGALAIIAGVMIILLTLYGNTSFARHIETATKTTATITEIEHIKRPFRGRDNDRYIVYVDYEIDGKQYHGTLPEYNSFMRKGQVIEVFYDPAKPYELMTVTGNTATIWIFIAIGAPFLIAGLVFLLSEDKKKRRGH